MPLLISHLKCLHLFNLRRVSFRCLSIVAQGKPRNSYFFSKGTLPLTSATLGDVINHAADVCGDQTAFVSAHQGISKTYLEFRNEAERLASGLIACGLRRGDRIAIYSPNCYEWPLTQFAAAKAGLILVNINSSSQPQEVEHCLKKVGCKAIISYDKLKKHDYYEILSKVFPDLPTSSPGNIQNKNLPNLKTIIMISEDNKDGILRFKDIANNANRDSDIILSQQEKAIQFDDPVNIQYTSGTTGSPKGAILNHHSIINNAYLACHRFEFDREKPVICCQVPLFHCLGCVLAVLGSAIYKGTCVFPTAGFDSVESLKSIEKYKCTDIFGTPTMYVDLLKTHKKLKTDISSIKRVLLGGAPPSIGLINDLYTELKIPQVLVGYGLTENSPAVSVMRNDTDYEDVIQGFMEPLDYIELKIVDNNGQVTPINTPGELCTKGHLLFMGYWEDEKKTAEAIGKANWFQTGDLAIMNEKGWVKIVGRIKDVVIRGGENIYVVEVENFLSSHPAIQEVNIVGVPDERLGEELCCWISVKPGMTLTEEEIRNYCKGKISNYKIPRYIMFVDEFPKTTSGKIKKIDMVQISIQKLNPLKKTYNI